MVSRRLKKSKKRMYGPTKLLVCGYEAPEHQAFLEFLEQLGFRSIPGIFVGQTNSHVALKELLRRDDRSGLGEDSSLKRAVIMSGFTQDNLHFLISAYRKANLPQQL